MTTPAPPAPYGNGSSYTPATDGCPKPFKPTPDRYSPPASNADSAGYEVPDRSDSYSDDAPFSTTK